MDAGAAADAGAGAGVSKRRAMVTESQSFLSRPRRDDTTGVALHQLIGDVVARFVGPRTPLAAIKTYHSRTFNIAAPAGGVAAKWEGGIECIGCGGGDGSGAAGFMVEAFASTDGDASAVTFVASEYCSRRVFIKLTPQAAAQARAAHTTAAEFAEARRLMQLGADAGFTQSISGLASMHRNGHGGPPDFAEALRLFRLAAAHGSLAAIHELTMAFYKGRGVGQDFAEAVR